MAIKKRYGSLVKGPVVTKSARKSEKSVNKELKKIKLTSTSIPLLKLPNHKQNNNNLEVS